MSIRFSDLFCETLLFRQSWPFPVNQTLSDAIINFWTILKKQKKQQQLKTWWKIFCSSSSEILKEFDTLKTTQLYLLLQFVFE